MKKHLFLSVLMAIALCMTAQAVRQHVCFNQKNDRQQTKTHVSIKQKYSELLQKLEKKAPIVHLRGDWWEPDTIVSDQGYAKEREIYTYNAQGLATTHLTQIQNEQKWENFILVTYSYAENDNLLSEMHQMWENNVWINFRQNVYTYDGNNMITELEQAWTGSAWRNMEQGIYTYDGNNNMLTELWQWWDDIIGWEDKTQIIYTYDEDNNNMLTELYQEYAGESWINLYLDTYTYSDNKVIYTLGQVWDDDWVNEYQANATYDGENLSEVVFQVWENKQWKNDERISFSYENDNLWKELFEKWIWENKWLAYFEIVYAYDGNNNLTEVLIRNWDYYDGWLDREKTTFQYANNNNADKVENWWWNENENRWEPDNNFCLFYYNNMQSEMWVFAQVATISYIKITPMSIDDLSSDAAAVSIFPNPVSGVVTISTTVEMQQLNIFDITGRLVGSQSTAGNQVVFDTGVLPKGVYLVQALLKDGGQRTGKLVVK
jgi:hypothetical protein